MNIVLFSQSEVQTGAVTFYKNDGRYQHIKKILKLKCGDTFKTGLINMFSAAGVITVFDNEKLTFTLQEVCAAKPLYRIRVILGCPRPIQLRRILRDLASLGIEELHICGTELGEKSYLKSNLTSPAEIEKYLIDGCSQAGEPCVPFFYLSENISSFFSAYSGRLEKDSLKILLDLEKNSECLSRLRCNSKKTIWLAIGSERGWSGTERHIFKENSFSVFSMGHRILRTETAAAAAVSSILTSTDLWGGGQNLNN